MRNQTPCMDVKMASHWGKKGSSVIRITCYIHSYNLIEEKKKVSFPNLVNWTRAETKVKSAGRLIRLSDY